MLNNQNSPTISLDTLCLPIQKELEALSDIIKQTLSSDIAVVEKISNHVLKNSGKKLRPLLLLLASGLCKKSNDSLSEEQIASAAVIELLHTATLLHDDVVDDATLRRNQKTVNTLWGNTISILMGDFLYSRAFQMLAEYNNTPVMQCLAETTSIISEGEILQLYEQGNLDLSEKQYHRIIYCKTAKLFESSAKIAALIENKRTPVNLQKRQALSTYGKHLGIAFQIIDDMLDYSEQKGTLGKEPGNDLQEKKTTLPTLLALQSDKLSSAEKETLYTLLSSPSKENLPNILSFLQKTQSLEITYKQAEHHAQLALEQLQHFPPSVFRETLQQLALFAIQRKS